MLSIKMNRGIILSAEAIDQRSRSEKGHPRFVRVRGQDEFGPLVPEKYMSFHYKTALSIRAGRECRETAVFQRTRHVEVGLDTEFL